MKYYDEYSKKFYDNKEACVEAENEYLAKVEAQKIENEKKANARKAAAEKVEFARKVMVEAQDKYKEELKAFCDAYGAYHYTTKTLDDLPHLFDTFFNLL